MIYEGTSTVVYVFDLCCCKTKAIFLSLGKCSKPPTVGEGRVFAAVGDGRFILPKMLEQFFDIARFLQITLNNAK